MKITKDNISIIDYSQVYKDNTSLQYRPGKYKIIVLLHGIELVSTEIFSLEEVIKARDILIKTDEVGGKEWTPPGKLMIQVLVLNGF